MFAQISSPLTLLVAGLACIDVALAQNKFKLTGVFTGVNQATGARPARLDIRDLQRDGPAFSLYIQALNRMYAAPETNLTSYFQVSGIHGRPYIGWDSANPSTPPAGGIPVGYCTHNNILFGTWHRPYLALLEQILLGHAQDIARTLNSPVFTTAANNLRMPYLDWALAPQTFPAVMSAPTVTIATPSGSRSVTNPLYRYPFRGVPYPQNWFPTSNVGSSEAFLATRPYTLRQPNANGQTQEAVVRSELSNGGSFLTEQVWGVFAKTKDFNSMSTSGNAGTNFEGPHGTFHVMVGGGRGHMSYVSYAGFDPVFWLHHTNIDRQVAMWQAINPDAWLRDATTGSGTWTIPPNSIIGESTPLTPFTQGDGVSPWTSTAARYTKAFGYSYPEVKDWLLSPAELSLNVTRRVNQLYNPNGILTKRSYTPRRPSSLQSRKKDEVKEWTVGLKVPNEAVGEGFTVVLNVGNTLVGKAAVLSAPTRVELDAGVKKVTYSQFSLGKALSDGGVDSEDVAGVEKFLKGNLKWEVVKVLDDTKVSTPTTLQVEVWDEDVILAESLDSFPTYGKKTLHPEITA